MKVFKNIAVAAVVFSGVVYAKQLVDAVQKKESTTAPVHESAQTLHTKIQSTLGQISVDQTQKNTVVAHLSNLEKEEAFFNQQEIFKIDDSCDHCQKLFNTEVVL